MEGRLMDISWFRDLAIIILVLVGTGALIVIAVIQFLLYRRIKYILDSVKTVAKTAQQISSYVGDEVVKPVIQIAAVVQGIRQGIDSVSKIFRKKGGRDE